jgi:hypothetical protein
VAGCCEHGNEILPSVTFEKFLSSCAAGSFVSYKYRERRRKVVRMQGEGRPRLGSWENQ